MQIENSIAYIEPGSHSDIWAVDLSEIGSTTLNKVKDFTMIGGDRTHISSDRQPQGIYSSANCDIVANGASVVNPKQGVVANGANIVYRYEN